MDFQLKKERRSAATQTLVVQMEDRAGAFDRLVGLLRRRIYRVRSMCLGQSEVPGISTVTLVLQEDPLTIRRIEADLYRLVDVIRVENLRADSSVSLSLALVKVGCRESDREKVLGIGREAGAQLLGSGDEAVIFSFSSSDLQIEALIQALQPFGAIELVKTGTIAMSASEPSARALPDFREDFQSVRRAASL